MIELPTFSNLELEEIGAWPLGFRTIILVGLVLAVLVLGYYIDLAPLWQQYEDMKNQKKTLEQKHQTLTLQIESSMEYKQQLLQATKTIAELREQLPQSSEAAELLEEISQQAAVNGLQLLSFNPLPEHNKGSYVEQPLEMTLMGNYHGFGEFVSRISSMSRIVTFHNFTLQTLSEKEKETKKGIVEIMVTGKTYWSYPNTVDHSMENSMEETSDDIPRSFYAYEANKFREPFEPSSSLLEKPTFSTRASEALELYPLDSLRMVGTLERNQHFFALLRDQEGIIHRVTTGNYVGHNLGRIENISNTEMRVQEWIMDDLKEYRSREVVIHLSK